MTERDNWNGSRYEPSDTGGHYESHFQRAKHPQRPLAFWIRYTVFSPRGRPGDAVGERWAIYFDGERNRITAAKEVVPIQACRLSQSGLDVRIGEAVLTEGHFAGRARSGAQALQWDLQYAGSQPPAAAPAAIVLRPGVPKSEGAGRDAQRGV